MSFYVIAFSFPEAGLARAAAGLLNEVVIPSPDAVTLIDPTAHPGASPRPWRVEALYEAIYSDPPSTAQVFRQVESGLGQTVAAPEFIKVEDRNWVALSQAGLPPVHAGRITVYGSHDRARVGRRPLGLEIEAGEAFGTAHHATTLSCLVAAEQVTRNWHPRRVLDLGCGSGVLGLAVLRLEPKARVTAIDIDPEAVRVAQANARLNGLSGRIEVRVGGEGGTLTRDLPREAYDLALANILAGPLIALAPRLATCLRPGGRAVLAGILEGQDKKVAAAYGAAGLSLERRLTIAGWTSLVLLRPSVRPRQSRPSA